MKRFSKPHRFPCSRDERSTPVQMDSRGSVVTKCRLRVGAIGALNSFRVTTRLGAWDVLDGREKRAAWRDRIACDGPCLWNFQQERRGGRRAQLKSAASSGGSRPATGSHSVSLLEASGWAWNALLRRAEVSDVARPMANRAGHLMHLHSTPISAPHPTKTSRLSPPPI
jgi:hypothetical protein